MKILNVLSNMLLVAGWLLTLFIFSLFDFFQLDKLAAFEITWVFYAVVTCMYFIGYWLISKLTMRGIDSPIDVDIDFD